MTTHFCCIFFFSKHQDEKVHAILYEPEKCHGPKCQKEPNKVGHLDKKQKKKAEKKLHRRSQKSPPGNGPIESTQVY